jgi:competence protein ComEA
LTRRVLPAREHYVETGSEWKVIDAAEESPAPGGQSAQQTAEDHIPRWLIGAIVVVLGVAAALAIWATLPSGGAAVEATNGAFDARGVAPASVAARSSSVAVALGASVIVDMEGAVVRPGVHELPDSSRVGDAIAAAGGYAANVDIGAASRTLNLAAKLTDGQQIHVPALGEADTQGTPAVGGNGAPPSSAPVGALIDLNHASADELDTLPGIGPVTAAKIIDARTQAPFTTVDELQSRGVVGQSTFDKLRDLITVTP